MSEIYSTNVSVTNSPLLIDGSASVQPVSGSVSVSNLPAIQPVSGSLDLLGSSVASITRGSTGTIAQQLCISNPLRKQFIITTENDGGLNYVALGSEASSVNYTYVLGPGASLTMNGWTGSVSLIRNAGSGNVQFTELS